MTALVVNRRSDLVHLLGADGLATHCGLIVASRPRRWQTVDGLRWTVGCRRCLAAQPRQPKEEDSAA